MIGELTPFSAIHHGALFDKARGGAESQRHDPAVVQQHNTLHAAQQSDAAAQVAPVERGGQTQRDGDERGERERDDERTGRQAEGRAESGAKEVQEQRRLLELKRKDREVRQKLSQQRRAAGKYGAAVRIQYERGPDGKRYAVDGEVQLDTSTSADRAETVEKMVTVRKAALSADRPSPEDKLVAAEAQRRIAGARMMMREELRNERRQASRALRDEPALGESEAARELREETLRELLPETVTAHTPTAGAAKRAVDAYARVAESEPPEEPAAPTLRAQAAALLMVV